MNGAGIGFEGGFTGSVFFEWVDVKVVEIAVEGEAFGSEGVYTCDCAGSAAYMEEEFLF